jgi:hypothetical protein
VKRFLAAVVIGLLAIASSGAVDLLIPETCDVTCSGSDGCATCMPSCQRCACCHQSVTSAPTATPIAVLTEQLISLPPEPRLPDEASRKILHVPKSLN